MKMYEVVEKVAEILNCSIIELSRRSGINQNTFYSWKHNEKSGMNQKEYASESFFAFLEFCNKEKIYFDYKVVEGRVNLSSIRFSPEQSEYQIVLPQKKRILFAPKNTLLRDMRDSNVEFPHFEKRNN